jgi:hypothetical protein
MAICSLVSRMHAKCHNRIGRAIIRMMARRGFHVLIVYVDDFSIICPTEAMAWYVFWALRILLRKLGFTVNMRAVTIVLG